MTILQAWPESLPSPTPECPARVYDYEMDAETVAATTRELVLTYKDSLPSGGDFVCFSVSGTSKYADLARTIEAQVFTDDLRDKVDEMLEELAPYEASSWFLLVVDRRECLPKGTLRIIEDSEAGFSSLNDIVGEQKPVDFAADDGSMNFDIDRFYQDYGVNKEATWDVGTIAVLRSDRRGKSFQTSDNLSPEQVALARLEDYIVSGLLYRGLYANAREKGIKHFVSLIHTNAPGQEQVAGAQTAYATLRAMGIPFYEIYGMDPKGYENDTYFQPAVAVVDTFDGEMRGHTAWRLAVAQAALHTVLEPGSDVDNGAKKAVARAQNKKDMVSVLLTGEGLDEFFVGTLVN